MNISFYPRIALSGIRKNKKLYLPFFITCIAIVAISYIMNYVTYDESLRELPYVGKLQQIMYLGTYVIAAFSIFFLIYTNSFLSKRRRKEFGLYNILGMSKGNIALVLLFETLFTILIALVLGLAFGILLSKFMELLLLKLTKITTPFTFRVSFEAVKRTLIFYILIFILLFIINIFSISKAKPIDLIKAEQAGEKEPRTNYVFGILGLVILGIAYYMALRVNNSVSAFMTFFIAVLMVIVATYLIFIASSVLICKLLKKNKKYYYQRDHFISTSSMTYRMKRNGAGLATICILSTMVLVMVSTTSCLYFGIDDIINNMYPKDISAEYLFYEPEMINDDVVRQIDTIIDECVKDSGLTMKNQLKMQSVYLSGFFKNEEFNYDATVYDNISKLQLDLVSIRYMPLEDYNRITGNNVSLNNGDALLFEYKMAYDLPTINFGGMSLNLVKADEVSVDSEFKEGNPNLGLEKGLCIVVPNYDEVKTHIISLFEPGITGANYINSFDTNGNQEENIALYDVITTRLYAETTASMLNVRCKDAKIDDVYVLYGTLFFLGVILSIVFVFATVLIIYYKQVCEGYEDQDKFAIMKKIGITSEEIKKTINSQMLMIFYLPLILAVLHLFMAFPMIKYMLQLLSLNNTHVFLVSTIVCAVVYSIVYAIIYKITSNTYYSIVNAQLTENYE